MKALLIGAGIEPAHSGLSPVWPDYSFSYIPPNYSDLKQRETKEKNTYKSLGLDYFVSDKTVNRRVHMDPEFETFTYGDQDKIKRNSLLRLNRGDLLVFHLAGEWQGDPKEVCCHIFGYFVVNYVVDWNELTSAERKKYQSFLKKNAHIRSSKSKDNLVIVKGYRKSKLLKRCIPITVPNPRPRKNAFAVSEDMSRFLGIKEPIRLSVPVWIKGQKEIDNLKMLLGVDRVDPEKFEGKMPLSLLRNIIDKERKLTAAEKLFFMNFMMSKSNDYRSCAENFGTDMYIAGFRNVDVLDEYFIKFFYKV